MYTTASSQWSEQPIADFDNTMEDSIYIAAVDPNVGASTASTSPPAVASQ